MKWKLSLLGVLIGIQSVIAQDRASDPRFRALDSDGNGKVSRQEAGSPGWFDRLDRNGDGMITPDELPARSRRFPALAAFDGSSINVKRDIAYGPAALQRLDIYSPKEGNQLPVMIYIHGGGWRRGDKAAVGLKPGYFTSHGFIFVSLNYRFVPHVDILRQLQDSADAIAWVHDHIAEYGGDPARLHLMGHSAGAHHVAILATNDQFLNAANLKLDVIQGVVELDTQALNIPELMSDHANSLYRQAFGADPRTWKQISPIDHVKAGKPIPPFLLVVADNREQKLVQASAFQDALRQAAIRCQLVEAPQHNHGSVNRSLGDPKDKVTQAMERFHDAIRNERGSVSGSPTGSIAP